MQTDNFTTAGLLIDAADFLDTYGWCRGDRRRGHYCALNAIAAVVDPASEQFHILTAAFRGELGVEYLGEWNDEQPEKRYVTRALRRTARKLLGANR